MGTGRRHGWLLAGTIAVLAVGAGPAPAFGAVATGGPSITYTAAAGETNVVTVDHSTATNDLTITDTGTATHTANGGCTNVSGVIHCPDSSVPSLTIFTLDGNDTVGVNGGASGHLSSIDVQGGAGDDNMFNSSSVPGILDYSNSNSAMTVDLASGFATSTATGDAPSPGENFFGFETIQGSAFADKLAGDGVPNVIHGAGGSDTIAGSTGNDILDGGTGTDTVTYSPIAGTSYPGAGTVTANLIMGTAQGDDGTDQLVSDEALIGSPGADVVIPTFGSTVQGGFGDDTIDITPATGGSDIDGGGGNDTLEYTGFGAGVNVDLTTGFDGFSDFIHTNTFERVIGTPFADTLTGDSSAQELDGEAGADSLSPGGGNDVLDGGAGRDSASFSTSPAAITASLAAGTATGNGSVTLNDVENLTGSPQGDTLIGDAQDNAISGGGGNDTIQGRAGDDILDGGTGTNTVSYADSSNAVFVDLPGGAATGDGADTLTGFINAIGSNWNDTIHSRDALAGTIDCGNGTDSAVVDATDTVDASCESVDNGTPPPPPPPPAPTTVTVTVPSPPVTVTVTTPAPPAPQLPVVKITSHPASTVKTKKTTARVAFKFSSSTKGASFKCSRDFGAFARCGPSTSYNAKVGKHTLTVEAVSGGLTGQPVTARFTVKKTE